MLYGCLIRPSEKEYRRPIRTYRGVSDPGEILAAVLHPEIRQFDTGQLGFEFTFRGDK